MIEVKELAPNSDYTIGGTAAYDKVVFAMVNLLATTSAPANVNISWTTAAAVAGVDDATAGNSGLALTGIAPTPSAGSATISFASSGSAPLTLQIFDASGSLVRTVIDGDQISAGAHQIPVSTDGMANGVYMVRLLQGAAMVNSRMVVIK
ncbi:MAG: T9SS type A sorting domain-containing protein [Bacteroidota bacterium]